MTFPALFPHTTPTRRLQREIRKTLSGAALSNAGKCFFVYENYGNYPFFFLFFEIGSSDVFSGLLLEMQ